MNYSQSTFTENASQKDPEDHFIGRALVKLEIRLETLEVKVTSLTKVVRLLQQYTEKKDLQFQKQTHNIEVFDSKVSKIDSLHNQLISSLQKFQELSKHIHSQSLKIEQINRKSKEGVSSFQQVEEKINFQLQEINRKIQGVESTMLENVRRNQTTESPDYHINSQNYLIQQLSFRIDKLESNWPLLDGQIARVKGERVRKSRKKLIQDDYDYGLGSDRSKKKRKGKEDQFVSVRRMKSK